MTPINWGSVVGSPDPPTVTPADKNFDDNKVKAKLDESILQWVGTNAIRHATRQTAGFARNQICPGAVVLIQKLRLLLP